MSETTNRNEGVSRFEVFADRVIPLSADLAGEHLSRTATRASNEGTILIGDFRDRVVSRIGKER